MDIDITDYFYERKFVPSYSLKPPFPKEVLLDITAYCNHACTFCTNPEIELKKTLNKELAQKFILEAYQLGARRLGVFGTGESFLYKHLHEYIRLAKETGFKYVYIKTNGALCAIERLAPVLDAGLDSLRFSIHAGTRESYKKIQGKDDFYKVLQNVRHADTYRKEKNLNVEITVSMVLTNIAGNELYLLKEQIGDCVDVWDVQGLNSQCGNLLDNNEKGEIKGGGPRYDFSAQKCKQPFSSLSLTPEGYISACIMDFNGDLIAGDFNTTGLKEIWDGEVFEKFRKDHLENNLQNHICYSCIYNKDNIHKPLIEEFSRKYRVKQAKNLAEKR